MLTYGCDLVHAFDPNPHFHCSDCASTYWIEDAWVQGPIAFPKALALEHSVPFQCPYCDAPFYTPEQLSVLHVMGPLDYKGICELLELRC